MKKLSIEEKAKAYDKAIEKLRSLHDDYDTVSTLIDIKEELENIFPELKENEDERIFEEIYKNLHTYYMIQRNKFVLTGIKEIWDDKWSKAKAWLEKRGERKPVWSEEDERLRKEIVNYLECQKEEEPTRKDKINSWISWILKHSFSEWTKEEKEAWNKRLDCIIDILDWAEEKGRISLSDCQDYSIMLKSIRPQNTWKPSKEQIVALRWVLNNIPYNKHKEEISGLLDQIKEL